VIRKAGDARSSSQLQLTLSPTGAIPWGFLRSLTTMLKLVTGTAAARAALLVLSLNGGNVMAHKGAEHHTKAAEHHTHAAHHHREAAKHHEAGASEKGAHHAHAAHGHTTHARHHADEAAMHHADEHGGSKNK
jgi:hypothetical protein